MVIAYCPYVSTYERIFHIFPLLTHLNVLRLQILQPRHMRRYYGSRYMTRVVESFTDASGSGKPSIYQIPSPDFERLQIVNKYDIGICPKEAEEKVREKIKGMLPVSDLFDRIPTLTQVEFGAASHSCSECPGEAEETTRCFFKWKRKSAEIMTKVEGRMKDVMPPLLYN
jgi:hypothetical protein